MSVRESGFSIIELFVAMLILAVLIITSMPSMNSLNLENQLTVSASRFFKSVTLARNEAISKNIEVILCQRNLNGTNCNPQGAWEDGWIIWADFDADNEIEAINQIGQREIISIHPPLAENIVFKSDKTLYSHQIVFNTLGEAHNELRESTQTFQLCSSSNKTVRARRVILLNGAGQAWQASSRESNNCSES